MEKIVDWSLNNIRQRENNIIDIIVGGYYEDIYR